LLGKLVASGSVEDPSRVVTVSSTLHERGELDWDDIEAGRSQRSGEFSGMQAYSNTKLMNVVFANELQRRIDTQPLVKGKITSYSLHPGVIFTGLSRENFFVFRYVFGFLLKLIGKNAVQGSQTTLMAALAPSLKGKGGLYLKDCEVVAPHADAVYTPGQKFPAGEKLWQVSGNLLNQRGIAVGVRQRPKPKAEEKKVGQLSKVQPANDDIAIVYAVVRSSVEEQAKVEGEYTIESFATQTVNGINYFIKVVYGDQAVHVRAHKALGEDGDITLHSLQGGKSLKDELVYF